MSECYWCNNKATYRIDGWAEDGTKWGEGFVYQLICKKCAEDCERWLDTTDKNKPFYFHGFSSIDSIIEIGKNDVVI